MEIKRRDFLKILGATGASAALGGCASEPAGKQIVPFLIPAEGNIPGQATWYATVCRECPAGCGMLAKTMEGRVIKAEGNPNHPVNQGRLCSWGQASLQGLYNPDRIRQPLKRGADGSHQPITWEEGEKLLSARLSELKGQGGKIAFVTPLVTGSLDRLIDLWLKAMGNGDRFRYEAVGYESLREANRIAFDVDEIPSYDIADARLVLSFGADFLETWLSPVQYAREFASMRAYREGRMGRFVYVGPRLSLTGANSDEWLAVQPETEGSLALAMVHVILAEGLAAGLSDAEAGAIAVLVAKFAPEGVAGRAGVSADKIRVLARAFARERRSLALVDGRSSNGTEISLAVNLLNYVAGNIGRTIRFGAEAAPGRLSAYQEMRGLLKAMEEGKISLLLVAGANPLFTLPEAERFRKALARVPLVVSFASFLDETSSAAHLVLPDHTFLESWGDYEPWKGVHGLQQPAMRPLYDTKATGDVLLSVAQRVGAKQDLPWDNFYLYLREQWKGLYGKLKPGADFEESWADALRQGGLFEASPLRPVRLSRQIFQRRFELPPSAGEVGALTLILFPSSSFYDGRMSNRPWMQETPDALTQIVWDNWAEIHPDDAKRLDLKDGDVVSLQSAAGRIELPAHISGGIKAGTVAIPVGQGHAGFGRYADGRGANPVPLLAPEPEAASGALVWVASRVVLGRTARRHPLVRTYGSDQPHDREIARSISLQALQQGSEPKEAPELLPMYPPHSHPNHRWGMSIDLNACIGCSACVVACYAENNIQIMGKEQVGKGREMSWIRIERFDAGEPGRPDHHFLPMMCQQCDDAPCEPVCPVYATYHNPEGLNAQIYNRCVGTRYCSNNCPYKVRRFNWLNAEWPEPLNLQLNPDVTVRSVGVMEKCTFCVQRIRGGELAAKKDGRPVRDGEIVPACAQTCPTQAIVFGDLHDRESRVSKLAEDTRRYRVLEHLNTQPAITYLKKIKPGPVED